MVLAVTLLSAALAGGCASGSPELGPAAADLSSPTVSSTELAAPPAAEIHRVFPVVGEASYAQTHHGYPGSDIMAPCGARYVALPASVPDGDVAAWIRRSCAWILVNEGLLRHRPAALAPLAQWDERGGVVLAPDRPAWAAEVAACDAGTPSRWCLVRVDP